jgi:aryl-alcohol dehydrogenase-like predicted oxidoreductase
MTFGQQTQNQQACLNGLCFRAQVLTFDTAEMYSIPANEKNLRQYREKIIEPG